MATRPTAARRRLRYRNREYHDLYYRERQDGSRSFSLRTRINGKDTFDGRPFKGVTADAEAVRIYDLLQPEEEPTAPNKMTMTQLWERVLAYRTGPNCQGTARFWGEGTAETHEARWRLNIEPVIGALRVQDVDVHHVNQVFATMKTTPWKHGRRTGVYSHSVIEQVDSLLATLFQEAMEKRNGPLRNTTPMRGADRPESMDVNPVDADSILDWETEVEPLFDALRKVNVRDYLIVRLAAVTGMRVSEICGLVWGDLDLDNGKIRLTQQLKRNVRAMDDLSVEESRKPLKMDKHTGKPKVRELILPPETMQLLSDFKLAQVERGRFPHANAFVFVTLTGVPMNRHNVRRSLLRAATKAKIAKPVGMHALRHAYASWLFAHGASAEEVQHDLGHSSATFTEKRYITVIPSEYRDQRRRELHARAGIR